jgi:predicted nucleic acid-binding protein
MQCDMIEEEGTPQALVLRQNAKLIAPELQLSKEEALLAARLLQGADIELLPTRSLLEAAARMAIDLEHPAYDCLYLALAIGNDCRFVTTDEHLLRKLGEGRRRALRGRAMSLVEAAAS